MKCQNCGRELKNGARFCIACGAQHDSNGQLIGAKQEKVDYNKTMMASNVNQSNNSGVDYNKTMMAGSTGFRQYQPEQKQQDMQNYNYSNNNYATSYSNEKKAKKKISPIIIIICPLIIVGALAFSLLSGRSKKKVDQSTAMDEMKNDIVVSTVSTINNDDIQETIHLEGYWSADAEHFYINGEMQKSMWIEDYYVDENGDKVVNSWIDNKYYVDATGKKARNEWIEFTFYGEDGQKKVGFYYVGSNGLKVTNEIIDGRYLNDAGCYWPELGEVIEQNEKKNSKIDIKETTKDETKQQVTTTVKNEMTIDRSVAQQTTIAKETVQQAITSNAKVINTVSGSGNVVGYYTTEDNYPDKKIKKYMNVVIDDANYTNLEASINEWTVKRNNIKLNNSGSMMDNITSVTYDIDVERNDGKIFSICETTTKYESSKASEKVREGTTWDAKTGQILTLDAIFSSDGFLEFTNKVIKKVEDKENSIDEDIFETMMDGYPEDIFTYCTWYMGEKGITLVFDRDNIGSSKLDGFSITFTYAETGNNINKLLLSKYCK